MMVGLFDWECGGCRLHEEVHRLYANVQQSHSDSKNTNLGGAEDGGLWQDELSCLLELGPN